MAKLIPTVNILVPLDVDHLELVRGVPVDESDIPEGSIARMLRLGQLVPEEDFAADPPEQDAGTTGDKPGDWKNLPVTVMDIPETAKKALVENGLTTVSKVLDYGDANGGLTKINGIGESSEAAVLKAIEALATS